MDDGFAAVQLHDTVQGDAELFAAFLHQLAGARAFLTHDPFFFADLFDVHFVLAGPGMVITYHGDDRVASVQLGVEALVELGEGEDRHVDVEIEQTIQGLFFR
ncbi:hypothetical protein D3C87_1737500 [compost metagenome]